MQRHLKSQLHISTDNFISPNLYRSTVIKHNETVGSLQFIFVALYIVFYGSRRMEERRNSEKHNKDSADGTWLRFGLLLSEGHSLNRWSNMMKIY